MKTTFKKIKVIEDDCKGKIIFTYNFDLKSFPFDPFQTNFLFNHVVNVRDT